MMIQAVNGPVASLSENTEFDLLSLFPELPVKQKLDEIINAVATHDVTVISAETGAGKSTLIPFVLNQHFRGTCVTTMPRRVAAQSVASFVAERLGDELGRYVGVKTGIFSAVSQDTKVLYATDGWVLNKVLGDKNWLTQQCSVLIIDEAHEENAHIDILIALHRKFKSENKPVPKLVIMSATIDGKKYLNKIQNSTIIQVLGRTFPVEKFHRPAAMFLDTTIEQAQLSKDVISFMQGKLEIEDFTQTLRGNKIDAEIIPLHGEIPWPHQMKVFKEYSRPKIIPSTNIAQSSITPDVDVVVSNGMKRVIKIKDGFERLCDVPCTQWDLIQQMGRVGRKKAGEFYLCSDLPFEKRPIKEAPQISNMRLEMLILKLAVAGQPIESLMSFLLNKPSIRSINDAKARLIKFGAMTAEFQVTKKGRNLSMIPAQLESAEIISRARNYKIEELGICLAAIMEVGGILFYQCGAPVSNQKWYSKWRSDEESFQPLGELNILIALISEVHSKDPTLDNAQLIHLVEEESKNIGLKQRKVRLFFDTLTILGKCSQKNDIFKDYNILSFLRDILSKNPTYQITGTDKENLKIAYAYGLKEYIFRASRISPEKVVVMRQDASDEIYQVRFACPISLKDGDVVIGVPFQQEKEAGDVLYRIGDIFRCHEKFLEGLNLEVPHKIKRTREQNIAMKSMMEKREEYFKDKKRKKNKKK